MRGTRPRFAVFVIGTMAAACGSTQDAPSLAVHAYSTAADADADGARWAAPALEHAVSIRDGRTGARVSLGAFFARLAEADAVFLGETHTDETTHRFELAVYRELFERKNGAVVLALEMFERDQQEALSDYVSGTTDEATFRDAAKLWSNYDTAYRPLIEFAREKRAPVVASNFPRSLRRRMFTEGDAVLGALEGDDRRLAPLELEPNTPAYWRRVDNAVRGHIGMMGRREDDDLRLTSTQSLWDNSMGEACVLALDEHPGSTVLHVNGGFHSAYWDGTVHQFQLRRPNAKTLTVAIQPCTNPTAGGTGGLPIADFVVLAETRGRDYNEGRWAVSTSRELEFDFHLPDGASDSEPAPLLIWLSENGLSADDGMALWKDRLGDHVAIVVLEAPYRELQFDLVEGGRWFWSETFPEDVGLLGGAILDTWAFLARYYPIDPDRVCIAGEGAGATVVATSALFDDVIGAHSIAFEPKGYREIKDLPLPLPELRGDEPAPERTLAIVSAESGTEFWQAEIAQYASIGFKTTLTAPEPDPFVRELARENAVRSALGLAAAPMPCAAADRHIVVDNASDRARFWARLRALAHTRDTGERVAVLSQSAPDSTALATEIRAASFASGKGLPLCPGAFGGTTVVVLPENTAPEELEAWLAIVADDPLTNRNRFQRLRIALLGSTEGRDLNSVLAKLLEEGRRNVLIVAGTFCSDGVSMQALRQSVRGLENSMTLHWKPGLG